MAYRSSGADNNGMVSNLKRFGVISSLSVEEGFRQVDRKFFVPKGHLRMAHSDQPIKEGNIHISAPHIYGSVMEALELPSSSSLSFLNAGSGTGYLTCIAASILGPRSSHHCIEIHADAVEHCNEAIASWKRDTPAAQKLQHINVIHGNAFDLDTESGECALGFDRIYIGASVEEYQLPMFKHLLKPGGILVGPVDGELMKIVRLQPSRGSSGTDAPEYSEEILSPVRFAPLVPHPRIGAVIPARVWTPLVHQFYPDNFRDSCKALLLCSHSDYMQVVQPQTREKINAASMLPRALWLEILSYTHRDWFEAPQSEVEFLRQRLNEEKEKSAKANRARLEAEARCHLAEKERDIYKLLALRWKGRRRAEANHQELGHENEMDQVEDAATAMVLGSRGSPSVLSLRNLFRRFRDYSEPFEEIDENEVDDEESLDASHTDRMDEDNDMIENEEDESSVSMNSERDLERASQVSETGDNYQSSNAMVVSRQVRTISITGEDI